MVKPVGFALYDGKARAAKCIRDREYAKECAILCDFSWQIRVVGKYRVKVGGSTVDASPVLR